MKKLILIISICFSSLCFADFDAVVILKGDDDRVRANQLIEGSDGFLYGTNESGGDFGAGSIFKIDKNGDGFQVLHSFATDPNDGIKPVSNVIEGSDGILYGTTRQGGQNALGTIFRINKDGSDYAILHAFSIEDVGSFPETALLEASDGALYGTTSQCGDGTFNSCNFDFFIGGPTIFKINKDGTRFSNVLFLRSVRNPEDERQSILISPSSSLIEGSDGYLYGFAGHLFKVTKDGNDANLLALGLASIDILDNNGIVYGISTLGGIDNAGRIFRINEDGTNFSTLRNFVNNDRTPSFPHAGLALDSEKGILYGVANGMVYQLNIDGTDFEIINATRNNNSNGILSIATSAPLLASDGALYGVLSFHAHCGVDLIPGIYSLKNSVETIFNWAESQFPQYFPTKKITQSFDPWLYRYYPSTDIYLGVNNNDNGIYVLGGAFGDAPLFIDSKKAILTQVIGVNAILCEN